MAEAGVICIFKKVLDRLQVFFLRILLADLLCFESEFAFCVRHTVWQANKLENQE